MAWLRTKAQSVPAFPSTPGASSPVAGSPRGSAFMQWIGQPDALYPEPDFVNNAINGFDKNELVYACIMEKATSLPEAPFRVFGPDGMGEPRRHPLSDLIAKPNPACTEFELMELTSIFLDLAGIAFWEIVKDRAGRPVEIWPLRPDLVRIFPKQNGHHEYGYAIGDGKIWPLGTDVIAFKYPNPMDPNLGQAPMRPANRAVALDNEATDFVKSLLQNKAVPGTVIETEHAIDEAVTERLTAKWIARFGGANRGQPAFLQKGMKVQTLGLDLTKLEFPDLRTISESRICMAFGVPPILVGAKVGLDRSTFANYGEARRSFWEETLIPLQTRMQQVIVAKLLPMFEGPRPRRVTCRFDTSGVLALKESEANRWEKGTNALRAGGLLVNDFRRYVGLPTVPGGDVFLLPAGVIPVADLSAVPTTTTDPAPETPDESSENLGESSDGAEGKVSGRWSAKQVPTAERTAFAKAVAELVEEQRAEVMAEIERSKALLTVAPDRFKAELWQRGKWNRRLAETIEPHMRRVARTAARKVDSNADVEAMDGYIHVTAERVAKDWNETTENSLRTAVEVGGTDVAENVANVFIIAAGFRATTLAATLSTEMNGFGKVDTAKRSGLPYKTWVVTSGNPRAEHAAMDGETVPVNEPFSDGFMWPGGPNCLCDVEITSEG